MGLSLNKYLVVVFIYALIIAIGCSNTDIESVNSEEWNAVIDTLGSTTLVHTIGGSVWGRSCNLIETYSIGVAEGEDPYMFGEVRGITSDSDHIYVLDWQVSTVRVYDHQGIFIRDIGRRGQGPGELRDPIAIGIDDAGTRLFIRERVGGLVHVFTPEGDLIETLRPDVGGNFFSSTKMMRVTRGGNPYLFSTMYTRLSSDSDGIRSRYVMLGIRPDGAVFDTLDVPWYDFPTMQMPGAGLQPMVTVPFSPNKNWNITRSGAMIGGVSAGYSFEVRYRNGKVLLVERNVIPTPVMPGEARWHVQSLTEKMQRSDPAWIWRGPAIPKYKPAFEAFIPDYSNRIWVLRKGRGQLVAETDDWIDSYIFDVFEENTGRYLGEVAVPPGIRFRPEPFIRDDLFIAYYTDDSGVPYIKCYHIDYPD